MPKLRDLINDDVKRDLKVNVPVEHKKKKRRKFKPPELTAKDIRELMGIDRPTYKKVNGKIKQR